MISIPSTNTDPEYRYRMPQLITKMVGRGNNMKTVIENMGDVARALGRPPQYTSKWFSNELGAQDLYTNEDGEGERSIFDGAHDTSDFQELLDTFIEKYVCCVSCHLPEIDLKIKWGNVVGKCKACGWKGDLDNNHKIAAFITKNPPDDSGVDIVLKKKKTQQESIIADQNGIEKGDDSSLNQNSLGCTKKDKKDKKDKKEKKEKKDKKEKKEKKDKDGIYDGQENWDSDDALGGNIVKSKKEKKEKKSKRDNQSEGHDSDARSSSGSIAANSPSEH